VHLQDKGQAESQDFFLNDKALYISPHKYSPKYMEHLTMYSVLYYPSLHSTAPSPFLISFSASFHFPLCQYLHESFAWIIRYIWPQVICFLEI